MWCHLSERNMAPHMERALIGPRSSENKQNRCPRESVSAPTRVPARSGEVSAKTPAGTVPARISGSRGDAEETEQRGEDAPEAARVPAERAEPDTQLPHGSGQETRVQSHVPEAR